MDNFTNTLDFELPQSMISLMRKMRDLEDENILVEEMEKCLSLILTSRINIKKEFFVVDIDNEDYSDVLKIINYPNGSSLLTFILKSLGYIKFNIPIYLNLLHYHVEALLDGDRESIVDLCVGSMMYHTKDNERIHLLEALFSKMKNIILVDDLLDKKFLDKEHRDFLNMYEERLQFYGKQHKLL